MCLVKLSKQIHREKREVYKVVVRSKLGLYYSPYARSPLPTGRKLKAIDTSESAFTNEFTNFKLKDSGVEPLNGYFGFHSFPTLSTALDYMDSLCFREHILVVIKCDVYNWREGLDKQTLIRAIRSTYLFIPKQRAIRVRHLLQ